MLAKCNRVHELLCVRAFFCCAHTGSFWTTAQARPTGPNNIELFQAPVVVVESKVSVALRIGGQVTAQPVATRFSLFFLLCDTTRFDFSAFSLVV